jgi:hypothetical protein
MHGYQYVTHMRSPRLAEIKKISFVVAAPFMRSVKHHARVKEMSDINDYSASRARYQTGETRK